MRKESGAYGGLAIYMLGRCDAMSYVPFAFGRIQLDAACRQCDFNFEADRLGVRCPDGAAVLTNCLKSNSQSKAGALG